MTVRLYWQREQWFSLRPPEPAKARPRGLWASGWLIIAAFTALTIGWMVYHALWQPDWLTFLPGWFNELINLLELSAFWTLVTVWGMLGWRRLRPHSPPALPVPHLALDQLFAFSPAQFEQYVAGLFRQKGYIVNRRGGTGDLGVDLELLAPGGRKAIVQCKRYQNTVGADTVRELYGTLIHEKALHAFLITTAEISPAAREWARGKPMTLIDGPTLMKIAAALRVGE